MLLFIVSILSFSVYAQDKQLTMKDAVLGRWFGLYPETLSGVVQKGNDNFTYVKEYNEVNEISKTGEIKTVVTKDKINEQLKKEGYKPLRNFPYWDYMWLNDNVVTFNTDEGFFGFDVSKNTLKISINLPKGAKNIKYCKSNGYAAYTIDNNLYFCDEKSKTVNVTDDKDKGIVNGSNYVHRQEFGIDNGIFWSPKGKYIAFYRKDETMVADYPLVDITARIAKVNNIKYPMIGEKSEEVTLGIYNLRTGKTVFADVKDFTAERYLTSITWGLEGKYIYIGVLNREQNHVKLNKYEAETGKFVKTLFEEKNDRYVEPEHQLIFDKNNPNQFLWYSERSGYNHLYLYNTDGKLLKKVTKGNWVVLDFKGFDKQSKNIFITATKDSPIETHLYKVNIKSGKVTGLSPAKAKHSFTVSKSGKYFIDKYSNPKIPQIANISETKKGKIIKELLNAKNPLKDYAIGNIKIGTIKSADGETDLYYRLITPPNFDKSKKYPTIVYVYGGPHAQLVTNSWLGGTDLWKFLMAEKGYVIFTVDNRGSANRGFEFESIIHRQCGVEEMKDQIEGVKFLKSLAYVDESKIGVFGWSYGGFMTTSLMTTYPDVFKAAVAGGPVIDWKYYEVMYGERYMDTPKENPEGFKKTSLLNKAKNLKGRLLIIHGYQDPVVVIQNSIDFIKHCIAAGTDIDYFIYPESEHNMGGYTRVHLMNKVTRYFDDFLKK